MPKIEIRRSDLENLVGKKITDANLDDCLLAAKAELDEVSGNLLKIDCKDTNRPDLWSTEGIARAIRGYLGLETGIPKYKVDKSKYTLKIDKGVSEIRPFMVACVVRNLKLDKAALEQMIQLQEKIAGTFGRKRREAAIGIFELDKLKPPFTYKAVEDKDITFVPLGFSEEMHPRKILNEHPKGKEYGHLISEYKKYPVLVDSEGKVCSMPPIINSEITGKVTEKTRNVLVEVSGYDIDKIMLALNVMASALAERGGKLESVVSILPNGKRISAPNFEIKSFSMNADNARKFLGIQLTNQQIIQLLKKARHDVSASGNKINISYLSHRDDIMHERDVIEDVAIMYGYNNIEPEMPRIFTIGKTTQVSDLENSLKEIGIGMGFNEIMSFVLTNKNNLFLKMKEDGSCCEIANPVSENWSALRTWLTPGMLEFLVSNKHASYPQCIFEVGDCALLNMKKETRTEDVKKVAFAISDVKVGYEDASSNLDAFMRNIGVEYSLKEKTYPFLIEGRSAEIIISGNPAGFIGEIHPQVLKNWGLQKAVVVFELDVSYLM